MSALNIANLALPHEDAIAILDALNDKEIVTLIIGNRHYHTQSMIIGADLLSSELLLGECFPNLDPDLHESLKHEPCWLKIKSQGKYLFVKIRLMSTSSHAQLFAIIDSYWSISQRWNSRVQFPPRTGPSLRAFHEREGFQDGWIKDLSAHGGCFELYGSQSKDLFKKSQTLKLHISFHHEFSPELEIKILETSFKRKPCCHTQIRFKFRELDDIRHTQLDEFVEAYLSEATSLAS